MKQVKLFLFILICTTACSAQNTNVDSPTAIPPEETTLALGKNPSAGIELDMTETPNLSAQTFIWVIDSGEILDDFYLTKLLNNGQESWQMQFESIAGIGLDPHDGSVWTIQKSAPGFESWLTKIDANGHIIRQVKGYDFSNVFAVDPNDGSVWLSLIKAIIPQLHVMNLEFRLT